MGLRFRGEFFNLFNHPNFGNPQNNLTDQLFGQSTPAAWPEATVRASTRSTKSAARARSSWRSSFNSEQRTRAFWQSAAKMPMPPRTLQVVTHKTHSHREGLQRRSARGSDGGVRLRIQS
jgi:hypothetical protein